MRGDEEKTQRLYTVGYAVALEHQEAGHFTQAADELRSWLAAHPEDSVAHAHLAYVLSLNKQDDAAWSSLTTAEAIDVTAPVVQRTRARLLLKRQQVDMAYVAAKSAWKSDKGDPENLLILAATMAAKGHIDKAATMVELALSARPHFAEALAVRAQLSLRAGASDKALADAEAALNFKPHLTKLWPMVAMLRYQRKDLAGAIEALECVLEIEPDNVAHMVNLGEFKRQAGDIDDAVIVLEKAVAIDPGNPEIWFNYGILLQISHRKKDARAAYERALNINPRHVGSINNLGAMAKNDANWESALLYFQKAIDIQPDSAEAHNNLGTALKEIGKLDEAVASYDKALVIEPDVPETHNNLGNAFLVQGKLDEAVASYHKALAIKPDYAEAHIGLGNAFVELGKLDEAIDSFDMAGTPKAMARSLECNYILERYDVFHTDLDKLIALDKSNRRAAAISAFAAHQLGHDDPYPFCKNPLDFIRVSHLDACASDTDALIDELLDELSHRSAVWEPTGLTTKFGFQTPSNLFSNPQNSLVRLEQIIKQAIDAYYSEYGSMRCTFIDLWPKERNLVGWSVRLLDQGYQTAHIHPGGWLSGVIYLKIPKASRKDEGAIEFSLHGYDYPILDHEYPRMLHQPKAGEIILFPSSLFHKTVPISGDSERLTISFDLLP